MQGGLSAMKSAAVLKLSVCLLCLLSIGAAGVAAEGVERSTSFSIEGAYYLPDNKGFGVSDGGFAPVTYTPEPLPVPYPYTPLPPGDSGRDLGSTWGPAEIQFLLTHRIRVAFLVGSGPLTSGNNATFSFTGALTPVSTRLETRINLTPLAFLDFYAGAMAGTGWDIGLFNGMGAVKDTGDVESDSFGGVVTESWVGGTFQFDLAALVPGDWTHLVTLISPKIQYAWFSGVEKGEPWMWEADKGENFNGWMFYGTYFLGYQTPLVLDLVGLLVETEQNLGYVKDLDATETTDWGSDYVQITVSPMLSITLSENSSLAVLFQFRRERLYTDASVFANYFINRDQDGDKTYWDFYRIAFSYGLDL
jgi:hypothetical protein